MLLIKRLKKTKIQLLMICINSLSLHPFHRGEMWTQFMR